MISAWTCWLYLRPCHTQPKCAGKESRAVMSTVKTQTVVLNLAIYVLDWFVHTCERELEQSWPCAHVQADHRCGPHNAGWRLAFGRINLLDGSNSGFIRSLSMTSLYQLVSIYWASTGVLHWDRPKKQWAIQMERDQYLRHIWRKWNVDVWGWTLRLESILYFFQTYWGSFYFCFF